MAMLIRSIDSITQFLSIRKFIKKIDKFEVYLFAPVICFLVYLYFFENACFPPGIDRAFLRAFAVTPRESIHVDNCWRQGVRYFPGAAKSFKI
jgi:hypothetical protein